MHVIDTEIRREPRLMELYEGLKWRLARQPDAGYPIPNTDPQAFVIHSFNWKALAAIAPILVTYTYDDDQVVIVAVRILR
jgi:hypothetical protein